MPYGLPGKHNENPKLNAWMENCVNAVQQKLGKAQPGYPTDKKVRAITICKAQLAKMHYKAGNASIWLERYVVPHLLESWVYSETAGPMPDPTMLEGPDE
jgi:hypothetical protein